MLGKRRPQLTTAVYHEFPDLAIEVFAWTVVERRDVKRRKGKGAKEGGKRGRWCAGLCRLELTGSMRSIQEEIIKDLVSNTLASIE